MNYLTIEKQDGIAILWLDQEGEKVNKLSPEMLPLMEEAFNKVQADHEVKAAVLISRKKDFIAGADVEKILNITKPGEWTSQAQKAHAILDKIAHSGKPFVAAIHGACLGGGLEVALACTARIAADDRRTALGLPEVKLGLLPGGGGTQRLPRLVGIQAALDMMLTGKNIYAYKAKKMGLVDDIVPLTALLHGAKTLALSLASKPIRRKSKLPLAGKILEGTSVGQNIIFKKAKEMVQKMTMGNYPAPFKIIECVEVGIKKGMNAGLQAEREKFEELIFSPQTKQLINIFFAMTDMKKNPLQEKMRPVKTLTILGAGFMGAGIAEVSVKDAAIVLKDIDEKTIASAKKSIYNSFAKKVKNRAMTQAELEQTMNLITGQLDYKGFEKTDMIIEAVFEDIGLKQRMLADCEAVTREDCIFASNTSSLPIGEIAAKAKRPQQVIGMHYFSPVPKMPLLEIIITEKTADWVTATALDVGIKQGKTCIVVKDGPGFYTTRILSPFLNEALLLLEEGAAIGQVDKAMKQWGFPVGPITLMDEVGIDVGAHVNKGALAQFFSKRPGATASHTLEKLFEAGYKGRKNRKGFFVYDEKGKKKKGVVNEDIYDFFGGKNRKTFSDTEIQNRMSMIMTGEALYCLQEDILQSPRDGDIGAIFGLGYAPFRGGPFRYIDSITADKAMALMGQLASKHGERFTAPQLLRDMAGKKEPFYKK